MISPSSLWALSRLSFQLRRLARRGSCVCVCEEIAYVLVCMGLLLGIVYAYRSIEIFSCHETGHEEQCSYTGPMHNI